MSAATRTPGTGRSAVAPRLLPRLGGLTALASVALLAAGGIVPASAAPPGTVLARASGVEIVDIDGSTLTAPTPLSTWSGGEADAASLASTGDVLKLNTTRTEGLRTFAGPQGASTEIDRGEFTLRDRPPVAFEGLRASCTPDGAATVGFDRLTIDGVDVTAAATAEPGWSQDLPDSRYGPTRVVVGATTTAADGSTSLVGLRIDGDSGASEISRVRAGVVSCAPAADRPAPAPVPVPAPGDGTTPAPAPQPTPTTRVATGVTVTAQDGTVLVDGRPRVEGLDRSATADEVTAAGGYPTSALGIRVATGAEGVTNISVDAFAQVPGADADPVAEYRWSALRVRGLEAEVSAEGVPTVDFADESSAVFVNGIWINTATDLYTGVDASGAERVRVTFGERVVAADGSTTVTALHYEDLTGTYPEVRLGTVVIPAAAQAPVGPTRVLDAFGVSVTTPDGDEIVAPQPRVGEPGGRATAELVEASDGSPSRARDVTVELGATAGAEVAVGSFRQVPGEGDDPVAEYRWPALRVQGLSAAVDASGAMAVSFADPSSAVFVNGVWINTATDLYTGVDAEGEPRVEVRFGERTEHVDGTVTLTALHYRDLTGTHPEVRLGQVTIAPGDEVAPPVEPGPGPTEPPVVPEPVRWSAYGLAASGASPVGAAPVATPQDPTGSVDQVDDGGAGQLRSTGVDVTSGEASGGVSVDEVVLYPGTDVEVAVRGLRVVVEEGAVRVTSDGGTIAGQTLPAGDVAAGTVVPLPSGSGRVVLNEQRQDGADRTVTGLRLVDPSGLAADVSVGVVTSAIVAAPPADGGGDGTGDGAGPDDGAGPSVPTGPGATPAPGALSPDGSSPAGTSGTGTTGALAWTGSSSTVPLVLALVLLLGGGAALLGLRGRRRAAATTAGTDASGS